MKTSRRRVAAILLTMAAALGSAVWSPVVSGQEAPPDQAFKAIHLVTLPADVSESAFLAALTDVNQAIAKAGCEACGYHLLKVHGHQSGTYTYIRESAWPGRAVYEKVHADAGYVAANKRHPELGKVAEKEIYNRYVEVAPKK